MPLDHIMSVNVFGHLPAVRMWVLQQHGGINKPREDSDCCLLRNEMLWLVPAPLFLCLLFVSLSLPPSICFSLKCGQSKHHVQRSQSQDLSEEEGGSALARCWWPGLEEVGRSLRNVLSFQRQQGIHIYQSMCSHTQVLLLDINICMTWADMGDPIISHTNSS